MGTLLRKVENAWSYLFSSKENNIILGNNLGRQWQSRKRIILISTNQIHDINTFHVRVDMAFLIHSHWTMSTVREDCYENAVKSLGQCLFPSFPLVTKAVVACDGGL